MPALLRRDKWAGAAVWVRSDAAWPAREAGTDATCLHELGRVPTGADSLPRVIDTLRTGADIPIIASGSLDEGTGRLPKPTDTSPRATGRLNNVTGRQDHVTDRLDHVTDRPDQTTGGADHVTDRADQATGRADHIAGRPHHAPDIAFHAIDTAIRQAHSRPETTGRERLAME